MMLSRRRSGWLALATLLFVPGAAFADAGHTQFVRHGGDSGAGSFRAAIERANQDARVGTIRFARNLEVTLESDVVYTGEQRLSIRGQGGALSGSAVAPPAETWDGGLFASTGGADLTIRDLAFLDSFNNGLGIFVPESKRGRVTVQLTDVRIDSSRFHGLFFDGQATTGFNTDDVLHPLCEDPYPVDSPASLRLVVRRSEITNNGTLSGGFDTGVPIEIDGESVLTGCPADFDGIRVDDGGTGGIDGSISGSVVNGNLADGIEFDERGEGSVLLVASRSEVSRNGETGTDDLDDGIDLDEADAGDLVAYLADVSITENRDEGLDFDEAGEGSAVVLLYRVDASENEDEGFKIDEEEAGDVVVKVFHSVIASSLSQDGVDLTEEGEGDFSGLFVSTEITGNDGSGLKAEQADDGVGSLRVIRSDLTGNADASLDLEGISETLFRTRVD